MGITLPDSLQVNSFLQCLSKNKKALQYFKFAKRCEPFANVGYDPWGPEPRDSTAMGQLGNDALTFTKSTRDQFLKLRYAYQAARMFHYAGMHEDSKKVYEQYIVNSKSQSAAKGWAYGKTPFYQIAAGECSYLAISSIGSRPL